MQLSVAPLAIPASSTPALSENRPLDGSIRRRARTSSYLVGYANRRRAQRFRIR